ncbi:hypothetical protein QUF90_08380 [Desulfococcaceae bacterium HSG9]|nr:hypothetical protein [Desulfococcaceae bacterium HSG9]
MIQPVFIAKQDGKTRMLSGASEIGFFGKIRFLKLIENNGLWLKPVGNRMIQPVFIAKQDGKT